MKANGTAPTLFAAAVLAAGLTLAGPAEAAAGDAGKAAYAKCVACHGAAANKAFKLKNPTDAQWAKLIKEGKKPGMPAYKNMSDADVASVIAYMRSLQKKK